MRDAERRTSPFELGENIPPLFNTHSALLRLLYYIDAEKTLQGKQLVPIGSINLLSDILRYVWTYCCYIAPLRMPIRGRKPTSPQAI